MSLVSMEMPHFDKRFHSLCVCMCSELECSFTFRKAYQYFDAIYDAYFTAYFTEGLHFSDFNCIGIGCTTVSTAMILSVCVFCLLLLLAFNDLSNLEHR